MGREGGRRAGGRAGWARRGRWDWAGWAGREGGLCWPGGQTEGLGLDTMPGQAGCRRKAQGVGATELRRPSTPQVHASYSPRQHRDHPHLHHLTPWQPEAPECSRCAWLPSSAWDSDEAGGLSQADQAAIKAEIYAGLHNSSSSGNGTKAGVAAAPGTLTAWIYGACLRACQPAYLYLPA